VTPLIVDIVPTPAATLVTVSGEVDLATVAQFRDRLDTAPNCDAVLKMSDVALLSAVGLRVLLDLQDRLAAVGAWLVLAAPSHPVRRVLDLTGLDLRLPMESTVEDALVLLRTVAREQRTIAADGLSQDADTCSVSVVGDALAATHAVKSGLMQEQAVILRVGAAAVTQASAELTAHAAVLRLQAQALRARAASCRRRGGGIAAVRQHRRPSRRRLRPNTDAGRAPVGAARRSCWSSRRRMRDSNPRGREPNTLSKRAP
jgi:anti-anti-sigma factor